jgi:hypothetical protein
MALFLQMYEEVKQSKSWQGMGYVTILNLEC